MPNPILSFSNNDTVKKVFSRKWHLREDGYKQMTAEFVNLIGESMGSNQESGSHMISFKNK